LQEQAGTLQRTDIGAELGLSHETVRRHRCRLGIAARPSGSAGHTKRNGWQRLRRFEALTVHPSVNAAAKLSALRTT
jgi:hypothetical protein